MTSTKTKIFAIAIRLILSSLILPQPITADEFPDIRVSGKVTSFGTVYFHDPGAAKNEYAEIRFQPEIAATFFKQLSLQIIGDIRQDTCGWSHGVLDEVNEPEHRLAVNLKEGYLEYFHEWLQVRAGKMIFDWSVTDAVSPGDNINPRDWIDLVEMEKTGVWAVNLRAGDESFVEAAWIPWLARSKLPGEDNPWGRPLPAGVSMGRSEYNRHADQISIRMGMFRNGFDLAAGFYHGFSYSPGFDLVPVSPIKFHLTPFYFR